MTRAGSPLSEWLRRLETLSPHEIELGLERVLVVFGRMGVAVPGQVIHVAGTNGKGSSVEMLRSLLAPTGRIGTYTSPHVIHYNERIRIDGREASDEQIISAFERVETARHDVPLTYFEFGTLAAMAVFESARVDSAILEVGMGGRLDAVNAIEPDAGLITNVSLDHCEWLGNDIETIAREKAGIMRRGRPVVFAEPDMPESIGLAAEEVGSHLIRAGEHYTWTREDRGRWSWSGQRIEVAGLAQPALRGGVQVQNAAGVLAVVEALGFDHLLDAATVNAAFTQVCLTGRMQSISRAHEWLLDVAHNPAAAAALGKALQELDERNTVAVVGMLDDKDVEGVVAPLMPLVDRWIATTAGGPRGIEAGELARRIANQSDRGCLIAESLDEALDNARRFAGPDGRILVTGSFYIVGPVLERLS